MDTVQVSAVKAAIQFCEDGNTIRKLNLRRAQKEIGIAEPDFQDTIRQILCLIRDCLKHKLTNDYYSEPRIVSFDAWSKNPDNRYDVCMQNIINGLDDVCELWLNGYSYPRICADIDYFDELYPSTYFQDIDLTSEQLDRLCQALIEKKYIASSTRSEDFRWLFQGGVKPEGWERVRWIKKSAPKGDDPYQLNKKALLKLLELLKFKHMQIHDKKLMRYLFSEEVCVFIKFNSGNYQNFSTRGCCYNELKEIVDNLNSSM